MAAGVTVFRKWSGTERVCAVKTAFCKAEERTVKDEQYIRVIELKVNHMKGGMLQRGPTETQIQSCTLPAAV